MVKQMQHNVTAIFVLAERERVARRVDTEVKKFRFKSWILGDTKCDTMHNTKHPKMIK